MSVFKFGHCGVDLFFVISGFIILYVHYSDINRPERLKHYVERRATRIFPTYWVALALTIAMSLAGGHAFPAPLDLAWSTLLLPSDTPPLLGIAWTLQHEIVFYAMFALLIVSRRFGLGLMTLWLALIIGEELSGGFSRGVPGSLFGPYNIEFFLGMAVAYWVRRHHVPAPRRTILVGVALLAATGLGENLGFIDGSMSTSRLLYGLPSAMIVLGAAGTDREGAIGLPSFFYVLGTASYSIYLFQFVFIGVTWKLWLASGIGAHLPLIALFPLLALTGIGGGVAMSRLIEYPMMNWIRRTVQGGALLRTGKG